MKHLFQKTVRAVLFQMLFSKVLREVSVPIFKIEPLDLKYLKRLPVIKIVEVKRHDDITGKAYKSRF